MPRQPLGDQPMTDAERQRKRRERLRQERGPVDPSPAAIIDALRKENAALRRTTEAVTREASLLRERIRMLEAEVAQLRVRPADPSGARFAETNTPPPKTEREQESNPYHAYNGDEWYRSWGNRPLRRVVIDIEQLLAGKGLAHDRVMRETIINAMLRHVGDQANIERGIPRKTYRKVLADLSPDRASGNTDAFIAFKKLDVKEDDGKRNGNSIMIADDKVRTMADHWRKEKERSERARAAAAKRKAARDAGA